MSINGLSFASAQPCVSVHRPVWGIRERHLLIDLMTMQCQQLFPMTGQSCHNTSLVPSHKPEKAAQSLIIYQSVTTYYLLQPCTNHTQILEVTY